VRKNSERKIGNQKLDTCRCLPENVKWIIANRETLIELLSYCVKKRRVSRRRGAVVGCESNSTIAIE